MPEMVNLPSGPEVEPNPPGSVVTVAPASGAVPPPGSSPVTTPESVAGLESSANPESCFFSLSAMTTLVRLLLWKFAWVNLSA